MTVTAKPLLEAKYAENSQTTQYTVGAGVRYTIIDKFTVANDTGSAATLDVHIVASGGAAGASNLVLATKSIAAAETYTCPELTGQVLATGGFISTLAGTPSALVIRISGREIT